MRNIPLSILSIFCLLLLADQSLAFLFVCSPEDSLAVTSQRILIRVDGEDEEITAEFVYQGVGGDFGWIVPLPSRPEIEDEDPIRTNTLRGCYALPDIRMAIHDFDMRNRCSSPYYEGNRTMVVHDFITPKASAVLYWIHLRDYEIPDGAETILREYESRGWVFAIFRVEHGNDATGQAAFADTGTVLPILFRFPSPQPVLPFQLESLHPYTIDTHVHVKSNDYMVLDSPGREVTITLQGRPRRKYASRRRNDPVEAAPIYTSCLRYEVSPYDAEDMLLTDYNPFPELKHENVNRRAQAATYIGRTKPEGAVDSLITFLTNQTEQGRESCSAIWALGEIGGAHAESLLLSWARHENHICRRECAQSLSRLGVPEAHRLYIEGFCRDDDPSNSDIWNEIDERNESFKLVLAQCDSSDIPLLRRVAEHYMGREAWEKNNIRGYPLGEPLLEYGFVNKTIGARSIAALAALSDQESVDIIRSELLAQSSVMEDDTVLIHVRAFAADRTGDHFFERGCYPKPLSNPLDGWVALRSVHLLLAERRDIQDLLYHSLLEEDDLPDYARITMLGKLKSPSQNDLDLLREITDRAIEEGDTVSVKDEIGAWHNVNLKLYACARSYVELHLWFELLDFVKRIPVDQEGIHGMVLESMLRRRPDDETESLERYIRREWERIACSIEYESALIGWEDGVFPAPESARLAETLTRRIVLGCEYDILESLVSDSTLHPYHRLYWIYQLKDHIAYEGGIAPAAMAAFESIKVNPGPHAALPALINRVEEGIEEARALQAYRNSKRRIKRH